MTMHEEEIARFDLKDRGHGEVFKVRVKKGEQLYFQEMDQKIKRFVFETRMKTYLKPNAEDGLVIPLNLNMS